MLLPPSALSAFQPFAHPNLHRFLSGPPPPLFQVRPYLMADGGNVEFVEIDGPVVYLRLAGACGSCPSSLTTMTMGIKRRLMERIPVGGRRGGGWVPAWVGRGAQGGVNLGGS